MYLGGYYNIFYIPNEQYGGPQYLPKRSMVIKNKIKKKRGRKKAKNVDFSNTYGAQAPP